MTGGSRCSATTAFDGDLDALKAGLVGRLRSSLHGRADVEAKLSHLADLWTRLSTASVDLVTLTRVDDADKPTIAGAGELGNAGPAALPIR